jgi:hypothetical protein
MVVEDKSLGEFNEWDEVAYPWTRHNGYMGLFLLGVFHGGGFGSSR